MQTEFRKVYLSRKKNLKSHFWWISSPLCHTVISVLYYESVKNIPFINITYILKYTASTELPVCLLLIQDRNSPALLSLVWTSVSFHWWLSAPCPASAESDSLRRYASKHFVNAPFLSCHVKLSSPRRRLSSGLGWTMESTSYQEMLAAFFPYVIQKVCFVA